MRILVTGNDNLRRIAHAAHLAGYGYEVVEAQTYRDAQTILKAGMLPHVIVINLKAGAAQARAFIDWVRGDLGDRSAQIVAIGADGGAVGADVSLADAVETYDLCAALHLAAC